MNPLPGWLIEILNGWLALMLPWVIFTAWKYLRRRRAIYNGFWPFYHNNKMAIALFILFGGLELRTIATLVVRHANSHGHEAMMSSNLLILTPAIFIIGGSLSVIGSVCWARVAADMPLVRPQIWLLTLTSLMISIGLALGPW